MRIKTIIVVLITILLTVVLMQNTDPDHLNFLWATFHISKLLLLIVIAGIGFVLGYLAGRPKRIRRLGGEPGDADYVKNETNTLSDDDKEYIN